MHLPSAVNESLQPQMRKTTGFISKARKKRRNISSKNYWYWLGSIPFFEAEYQPIMNSNKLQSSIRIWEKEHFWALCRLGDVWKGGEPLVDRGKQEWEEGFVEFCSPRISSFPWIFPLRRSDVGHSLSCSIDLACIQTSQRHQVAIPFTFSYDITQIMHSVSMEDCRL